MAVPRIRSNSRLPPVYARLFVLRFLLLLLFLRRRFGTFAPARRASERPIAIACLRLVTLRPDRPLRSVPRLRSRMTFSTFFDAFLLYFLAMFAPCDNGVARRKQHDPCQDRDTKRLAS
jgi:hypothetical protein